MEGARPSLTPVQILERLREAQNWLDDLDENDPTYSSKLMVAQSRLSNLEESWKNPIVWDRENREIEENLRSAQQVNQFQAIGNEENGEDQELVRRPRSNDGNPGLPSGFAPYAGSSVNPFGGHFASDGAMAGQGRPAHAPTWNLSSENTTAPVTPAFSNGTDRPSSASASSVDSAFINSRKRQRDSLHSHGDFSRPATKAHRSTLSSPSTAANTPSSYESPGHTESIPEDFFGLFGGDPNEDTQDFNTSKKEQAERMRAMQVRREQELADEAFARSLQDDFNNGALSSPQIPRAGPSNFTGSQTYFGTDGQIHRPARDSSPIFHFKDEPSEQLPIPLGIQNTYQPSAPLNTKEESNPFLPSSSRNGVKREPQPKSSTWDEFVTISDDDEPVEPNPLLGNPALAAHPSSDLFEIDAQSWGQSVGLGASGAVPSGNAMPSTSSNNLGTMGTWESMRNTAQGYATGVSNNIGGALSELGELIGLGSNSVYGGPGSMPVIDLDGDDDYTSGDVYQQSMTRAGLNPMDVDLVNRYRERYDYIRHDPTKNAKEMKELLENIRPDEDLPPENREGTPTAMMYPLMEHQKLGVAWMKRMEEGSNRGGSKYQYNDCRVKMMLIEFLSTCG